MRALALLALCGCAGQMSDQPRYEPFEASDFFPDGRSARPAVEGTVPRGGLREARAPAPTRKVLERGRDLYGAHCFPCHGLAGYGDGPVVGRGFTAPPSYHSEELRAAAPERFVKAMTEGYGVMDSYAARVEPEERWAVAAYIRALQLSQRARLSDLLPDERRRLEAAP